VQGIGCCFGTLNPNVQPSTLPQATCDFQTVTPLVERFTVENPNNEMESPAWRDFDLPNLRSECHVQRVCYADQIDSTNDWAIRDAETAEPKTARQSSLYLAGQQTAGRGRGQNQWLSLPGSLTFSLRITADWLLANAEDPRRNLIPLAVGCGISDVVMQRNGTSSLLQVGIKWPNDIYALDQKMAGVLVEGAANRTIVIGCGMNVNNETEQIARQISPEADSGPGLISLAQFIGHRLPITQVTIQVVNSVLRRVDELKTDPESIVETMRKRDWLLSKKIAWNQAGRVTVGKACGITNQGALRFLSECDGMQSVYSGNIRPLI